VADDSNDNAIAIVGMAGRFPGAENIDQFWDNLKDGLEALSFPTEQELRNSGVSDDVLARPNYVKAAMKLDGIELFDREFFGYSAQQSTSIDPQQRLFLECAWNAIENAGYNVDTCSRSIGVFAGVGANAYLLTSLATIRSKHFADWFQTTIDSDKDFLATRISYKLNLNGPSVTVQTACSTSLVAVHLGCQSLLSFECDMALAGGVSIQIPHGRGYLYEEGGILSPDGHCRAFDARAGGTVPGSGAAIVALKRLADAINDGDSIYAVIKGSAINNDGALKVGYTAPGVYGQSQVIAAAMAFAKIEPKNIGLVEAHGTGTALGDAIELTALNEAFRAKTSDRQFCVLGSVKPNIGHLDTASGVAGLIKATLCLKNEAFVPSLNFENPNPILAKGDGPFYVNTVFRPWPRGSQPRYAAVSSFGIGGTNAHIILGEAPPRPPTEVEAKHQLIALSARSEGALAAAVKNLAKHVKTRRNGSIADLAYTLQIGRKKFNCRRTFIAREDVDLLTALEANDGDIFIDPNRDDHADRPVIFLFPGQGIPYVGAAARLYETESFFRKKLDECASLLEPRIGFDIREVTCSKSLGGLHDIHSPLIAQPALFAIEYCLASLWMNWGVMPAGMIGHSLGEYAAVCLAEACSLDEAIDMVVSRAKAIADLPPGAMIAVGGAESRLVEMLGPSLALAAINAPERCVVSGPMEEVEKLAITLSAQGIACNRLPVSHAFHSQMMEPASRASMEAASRINFRAPKIPIVSCLTGKWIAQADIARPAYWGEHVRSPVRFSAALAELHQDSEHILLEVGPGESMTRLIHQQGRRSSLFAVLTSLKDGVRNDQPALLKVLGQLWLRGAAVDWSRLHSGRHRNRVAIPTYPFERQHYWFEREADGQPKDIAAAPRRNAPEQWFYIPSWSLSLNPSPRDADDLRRSGCWLVLLGQNDLGNALVKRLQTAGCDVVEVGIGSEYGKINCHQFLIDPRAPEDYHKLILDLAGLGKKPARIIHILSLTEGRSTDSLLEFDLAQENGYFSLLYLAQAVSRVDIREPRTILVVTNQVYSTVGQEACRPEKATLAALCKVISQELSSVSCAVIDLPDRCQGPASRRYDQDYIEWIIAEAFHGVRNPVIAYRGSRRMIQTFESAALESDLPTLRQIRSSGFYVITGGLGRIGLTLARYMAERYQARLLLIGREQFPERAVWNEWMQREGLTSMKVRCLQLMEAMGARVKVATANISVEEELKRAIMAAEEEFGAIHGVFHLAGETKDQSLRCPLHSIGRVQFESQMRPKVHGFYALRGVLKTRAPDFVVLFSSNASILGGAGFAAYAAANAFLDHVVADDRGTKSSDWITMNWDGWLVPPVPLDQLSDAESSDPYAITSQEGLDALCRILAVATVPQVVVSAMPLEKRLETWVKQRRAPPRGAAAAQAVSDDYVAPRTRLERVIADIWEEVLGISNIGVESGFLELGGDSLTALRMITRLRELFNVDLPLRTIVQSEQTVAALAGQLVYQLAQLQGGDRVHQVIDSIEKDGVIQTR
jgi:acyl transferase domain-containing protein/acyl carrier protein